MVRSGALGSDDVYDLLVNGLIVGDQTVPKSSVPNNMS